MNEYEWAKHIQKETYMEKWYVIQVRSKAEEKIRRSCEMLISKEILKECFIPKNKRMKKIKGNWIEIEEILFKGYVFAISDDVNRLYAELKNIPDLTKVVGRKEKIIYPISDEEATFLKEFAKENHKIDMSYGFIVNDKIIIESGPLKGREGLIKKIDRHKRKAIIEMKFLNQTISASVGLEIIRKS